VLAPEDLRLGEKGITISCLAVHFVSALVGEVLAPDRPTDRPTDRLRSRKGGENDVCGFVRCESIVLCRYGLEGFGIIGWWL
jgi:hypothetical protein